MLQTNTNFDAKNALNQKTPMYLVVFGYGTANGVIWFDTEDVAFFDTEDVVWIDTVRVDYCNHKPKSPVNTVKQYLKNISGLSQKVTPEEGKSSISSVTAEIVDKDEEITNLISTDTTSYFQNRLTTVRAGYLGLDEADMVDIFTGRVAGYKESKPGAFVFSFADAQKAMRRKLFRAATDDNPETFSGNPINMFLAWCMSTGDGTNGDYDYYAEENGLAISEDEIDVSEIEQLRDDYYPGDSHYMSFDIRDSITAKTFFEKEIFKPLNMYLITKGDGKISLASYKPALPTTLSNLSFNEEDIIGIPSWDANLQDLVNEVIYKSDYDADNEEFDLIQFFVESTSLANRGEGKKTITIESKGFKANLSPKSIPDRATSAIERRINNIWSRYATPPNKIIFKSFFSKFLAEGGDIVSFSHSLLPNLSTGERGFTSTLMEVISRTVDWTNGNVTFTLLDTGFAKEPYQVISPTMTITSGTSSTEFEVSSADAEKYENFTNPVVDIMDAMMRRQITAKAISSISGTTITIADMGQTPEADWIVVFSDYDDVTTEQKNWGYIANSSDVLGTDEDPAHLIIP